MRKLSHTKAIFQQLGDTAGASGVKTIIENHDAWLHNDAIRDQISVTLRAQLNGQWRPESVARRIESQRSQLSSLVTRLPCRLSSAG